MAAIFRALGNEHRLEIFRLLSKKARRAGGGKGRELCVCHIAEAFPISDSTLSHHLDRLRRVGLLRSERRGQWIYYRVDEKAWDECKRAIEELG